MVLKSLIKLLDDRGVKYDVVEHKTVYTALDSANTQRVKLDEVVKTLVLKIDNGFCLALVSANKNLDKDKLKKVVNNWINKVNSEISAKSSLKKRGAVKKVDFAKEDWMKKNIKGDLGATPPFGELLGLPTFIDAALLKQKVFYINSGDYNYSIKITRVDFEKVPKEAFAKGGFSIAKKIKKQKPVKKSKKKTLRRSNKRSNKKVKKVIKKNKSIKKGRR